MADKIRLEIVSAEEELFSEDVEMVYACLLYTSPSPRDAIPSRMPSSA